MSRAESSPHIDRFPFADNPDSARERQKPIHVVNVREMMGMESQPDMREKDLTGDEAVDAHLEPLSDSDASNVIIGIPHEGELAPKSFVDRLSPEGRETIVGTDNATRDIFGLPDIAHIKYNVSRYISDPNRAPFFEKSSSSRQKPPGDILWKSGIHFGPMYQQGVEPTSDEARRIAEKFYMPYYHAMLGAVGRVLDHRHNKDRERVLVIDGHSFPTTDEWLEYYHHYGVENPRRLPMFILGTRDNQSCDGDIVQAFALALRNNFNHLSADDQQKLRQNISGDIIGVNMPFKGVHNVAFWGQTAQHVSCIQVECNEDAYMDFPERKYRNGRRDPDRVRIVSDLIRATIRDVDSLLKGH